MYTGPNLTNDNLKFGYDTGMGISSGSVVGTRFAPGEPTTNLYTNSSFANGETGWSYGSWHQNAVTHTAVTVDGPYGEPITADKIYVGVSSTASHFHQGNGGKYVQGTTYTTSAWVKGFGVFKITSHWGGTQSFTLTGNWQHVTMTVTAGANSGYFVYFMAEHLTVGSCFYITRCQTEASANVTPYVTSGSSQGVRSNTTSLLDLTGTYDINVGNITYDSNAQPFFDGSNDIITVSMDSWIRTASAITVEGIVVIASNANLQGGPWALLTDHSSAGDKDGFWWHMNIGSYVYFRTEDTVNGEKGHTFSADTPFVVGNTYHIATVIHTNGYKIYVNGVLWGTRADNFKWSQISSSHTAELIIGRTYPSYFLSSTIPVVKVYNTELTADNISSNYKAYKKRFNI